MQYYVGGDNTVKGAVVKMFDNSTVRENIEILMLTNKGSLKIVKIRQGDRVQIVPQLKARKRTSERRNLSL